MDRRYAFLALALAMAVEPALAGDKYPPNRTIPAPVWIRPEDRLRFFGEIGQMIGLSAGEDVFIAQVHLIRDAGDPHDTICGLGYLEKRKRFTVFVITETHVYVDVTAEGLDTLGCMTSGGLTLAWYKRTDGADGMEIR